MLSAVATGRSLIQRVLQCECVRVITCNSNSLHLQCLGQERLEYERKKERQKVSHTFILPAQTAYLNDISSADTL
jgi:hypothetical protein